MPLLNTPTLNIGGSSSNVPVSVTLSGPSSSSLTTATANANLGALTDGTTINLLPSSAPGATDTTTVLSIGSVVGGTAINGFGFNDVLKLTGVPSITGDILTLPTGTITLSPPPSGTYYHAVTASDGSTQVVLSPKTIDVYRFFDSKSGTQFYTADAHERDSVHASRPDLVPEGPNGVGLQAIDPSSADPNAVKVFRFFDTKFGTHFFTSSTTERDAVLATRADLVYEPNSYFLEHATAQVGDKAVYRFFDSVHGTHFYTDSETERASVLQTRPDLVAEGIGFYEPTKST